VTAKGKKCSSRPDVRSVRFIEPLVKEGDADDIAEEEYAETEEVTAPEEETLDEEPTLF